MLDPVRQTILYDQNAIYYGYGIEKLMEKAGEGIARELLKKYGRGKRIAFVCGPGNNGGDGFAAARYLEGKADTEVFLVPDAAKINTTESRKNWEWFKGKKKDNVQPKDIPHNFDVVVECLFGTGVKGKLREPYPAIIKKINRMKGKKVTIDLPAPDFISDFNISMMFPKAPGAVAVDIGFPKEIAQKTGVGEVKVLNKPDVDSHKGDNGKLLIIAGSEQYHGALLLATQVASKIVDLVYVSSISENIKLINKLKSKLADFITVEQSEIEKYIKQVDAVLIGPGLGVGEEQKKLVNRLLKKYKNTQFVLDADALNQVNKNLLNNNCIVTPHAGEFKTLFGTPGSREAAKRLAKKHKCVIVLKGKDDYVCDYEECKVNKTGNTGMTKGGTGDVLAGLIASLACKNELFLAASAGVFINGLAGDRLYKRVGRYYSASDLVREIPRTIKWCEQF